MQTVTLDGLNMLTVIDAHLELKRVLNFPDYYGMNLYALRDCLSEITYPLRIQWKNYKLCNASTNGYADDIVNIVDEVNTQYSYVNILIDIL